MLLIYSALSKCLAPWRLRAAPQLDARHGVQDMLAALTLPARPQVSDLDGTMVGDDAAQRAFAHYWHTLASPTGSRLVYSTGRSLDSFLGLARDKGTLMVRPHVLICAVGTKVYLPAVDGRGWREDPAWTARLDQGWDLEKLRRITNGASCVKPPSPTAGWPLQAGQVPDSTHMPPSVLDV